MPSLLLSSLETAISTANELGIVSAARLFIQAGVQDPDRPPRARTCSLVPACVGGGWEQVGLDDSADQNKAITQFLLLLSFTKGSWKEHTQGTKSHFTGAAEGSTEGHFTCLHVYADISVNYLINWDQ